MDLDYDGAVAWVSGAGSGIGRSLAGALAERGATVVATDINLEGAKETAERHPDSVIAREVDVADAASVAESLKNTVHDFGRIDLMFNNAGIVGPSGEYRLVQPHHWDAVLDVNLRGVINGVSAAYPIMIDQEGGRIVNTASAAGLAPTAGAVAYSTTKHAVVGLSLSLRAEAAAYGVGVTVLCPGALETPILDPVPPEDLAAHDDFWLPDVRRLFRRSTGIKDPDDFARYALDKVADGDAVVVYGRRTRALVRLSRHAPGLFDRVSRFGFARERRQHVR